MERIFWVKNGSLDEVNKWLEKGGTVKSIHAVSESVSAYGYAYDLLANEKGSYSGDIYAYIVVEFQ